MDHETIVRVIRESFPETEAIFLFGSFGTEYERPDSDIDIALILPPHSAGQAGLSIYRLKTTLEEELSREVDLINLRQVNTVFQHEIMMEGRCIYHAPGFDVGLYKLTVMSLYQKLNEERSEILDRIFKTGRVFQ